MVSFQWYDFVDPTKENTMKETKRNSVGQGLKRSRRADFRTSDAEYELLMREAFEAGHGTSWNKYIRSILFTPARMRRLEMLRQKHRAAREPDTKFLHAARLREMGRKPRMGRHPSEMIAA
jgi:hypothetical protein